MAARSPVTYICLQVCMSRDNIKTSVKKDVIAKSRALLVE